MPRQRGLSLIELMVGIVVALLVSLAASATAIFFGASQRQGVGTSVATVATSNALGAIKEDAAQAGLGFLSDSSFKCAKLNLSIERATLAATAFSPMQITRDSAGFDQLDIVYATDVVGGATADLAATSDTTSAQLATYLPATTTSPAAVLLAPAHDSAGDTCTVRTVTAVTPADDTTPLTLTFGADGAYNQVAFSPAATYSVKDKVSLLGSVVWHRYRIADGNLVVDLRDAKQTGVIVVRNVVAFRVQYATADASASSTDPRNTTITNWNDATAAAAITPDLIDRVRAIRIGMVTRSAQPEKRDANNHCTATDSKAVPTLFNASITMPPGDDWQCYRYRSDTALVPLRNINLGLR